MRLLIQSRLRDGRVAGRETEATDVSARQALACSLEALDPASGSSCADVNVQGAMSHARGLLMPPVNAAAGLNNGMIALLGGCALLGAGLLAVVVAWCCSRRCRGQGTTRSPNPRTRRGHIKVPSADPAEHYKKRLPPSRLPSKLGQAERDKILDGWASLTRPVHGPTVPNLTAVLEFTSRSTSLALPGPPEDTADAFSTQLFSQKSVSVFPSRSDLYSTLDNMHRINKPLIGCYRIVDPELRWMVPQRMVHQPAISERDGTRVSLEFFLSESFMNSKLASYNDPVQSRTLPRLLMGWKSPMVVDEAPVASKGTGAAMEKAVAAAVEGEVGKQQMVVSPFVVVEAYVSLQRWGQDATDSCSARQVLLDVAAAVADLHSDGLVHTCVSSSNIIWIYNQKKWGLMGFETAAKIGAQRHVHSNLHYEPPEAAAAMDIGQSKLLADPAADIWTLGVIAMELFLKKPAFPIETSQRDILAMLMGREDLPWEDAGNSQGINAHLGPLMRTVLSCLAREPDERPTALQLVHTLTTRDDTAELRSLSSFNPTGSIGGWQSGSREPLL